MAPLYVSVNVSASNDLMTTMGYTKLRAKIEGEVKE